MKEKNLYKIGEKLGITETEIKTTLNKNRNKIIAAAFVVLALVFVGNNGFQPLHYISISIKDFGFFMRFF
jgi:hypothetical protein